MILLDTDHLSILLQPAAKARVALVARLMTADDPDAGTTIVSVHEQFRGWTAELARARKVDDEVRPYEELSNLVAFLKRATVLAFSATAAAEFNRLRAAGVRIGSMDLKIASIALVHGALLLSANLRDFRLVPGLRVEDWLA